jgi:hypothetical protein
VQAIGQQHKQLMARVLIFLPERADRDQLLQHRRHTTGRQIALGSLLPPTLPIGFWQTGFSILDSRRQHNEVESPVKHGRKCTHHPVLTPLPVKDARKKDQQDAQPQAKSIVPDDLPSLRLLPGSSRAEISSFTA